MKKIKLDLEDDEHDVLEKIACGDKGDDGEIKGFFKFPKDLLHDWFLNWLWVM